MKGVQKKLESLVTVNTFNSSDHFYFKKPVLVGTINGKPAYVTFFYSHYSKYLVFHVVFNPKSINGFNYLSEDNMKPKFDMESNELIGKKFRKRTQKIDIVKNYLELVLDATKDKENIEHNKSYRKLHDQQKKALQYLEKFRDKKNDGEETFQQYKTNLPKRLLLQEYTLANDRYVNLKPNKKAELEVETKKNLSEAELKVEYQKELNISRHMDKILKEIFGKRFGKKLKK